MTAILVTFVFTLTFGYAVYRILKGPDRIHTRVEIERKGRSIRISITRQRG